MDTETLIKKLAATTAPRRVMTGVCDALIERDELRAENKRLLEMLATMTNVNDWLLAGYDEGDYEQFTICSELPEDKPGE